MFDYGLIDVLSVIYKLNFNVFVLYKKTFMYCSCAWG